MPRTESAVDGFGRTVVRLEKKKNYVVLCNLVYISINTYVHVVLKTLIIIVLNLLFFAAFPLNKVSGHRRFHAQTGKEKDQNGFAANRRRLRKRREG